MEILHLSAECYPVAKAGGLGDVVGALPKYQARAGHFVKVVMPFYQTKFVEQHEFVQDSAFHIQLGDRAHQVHILKEKNNTLGFDLFLVRVEGLLDRPKIYAYDDDDVRFLAFQTAVLDWLNGWEHQPDVVHCHDHHSGLVPFFLQNGLKYRRLRQIRTVFTIHNGNYQGWTSWGKVHLLPTFAQAHAGLLDWDGVINPVASAVRCADAVTTVSPSYMQELMDSAGGLEVLFRQNWQKCHGILNGIDTETWNPATDPLIDHHYNVETVGEGKWRNKQDICRVFDINPHLPLTVFIGRLVGEKAADVLSDGIRTAVYATRGRMSFVILGSGDSRVEGELEGLKYQFPQLVNTYIGYNEALSHKMYAAADFLLMPSRVEPCGLNQMYALRYGTMPMVRDTGGLHDTVVDMGDGGWGLRFLHASAHDIALTCSRAVAIFEQQNSGVLHQTRQRMMQIDHSWESSTSKYNSVYQEILI